MSYCSEQIQISIHGDAGDDYETLVSKAMARASEFLPGKPIRREPFQCEVEREEWYVACVKTSVSPGGTTLSGTVAINRYEGDGDE